MQVSKKALVDHLQRIHCGGLIPDVVLSEGYKAEAVSVSKDVMVFTSNMAAAEPLPHPIGVINLDLLIKVIKLGDDDKVSITLSPEKNPTHIAVDSDQRSVRLVMASPTVISSRVEEKNRSDILNLIPADAAWVNLPYRTVTSVLELIQQLSADMVTLEVGKDASRFIVGDTKINSAIVPFADLKSAEEYSLLIQAKILAPVFKQLSDFTKAAFALTGKESVVGVREGAYVYIVSPDATPASAAA